MSRNNSSRKRQEILVLVIHLVLTLGRNEALTFFSRCISISVNVNVIQRQNAFGWPKLDGGWCMSDQIFQNAYARVRGRHSDQAWFALTPREITDLIYREMRVIDRERLRCPEVDESRMAVAAE
jgi:hypothetical protein